MKWALPRCPKGKHFLGLPKMSVVTFSKALETHSKSDRLRRRCFPEELMPIFNEIEMQNTGLLPGSDQEAVQIIVSHARDSVSPERRQTACAQSESSVHFFQNAGLRFHTITAGPKDGPVVVLLHGFPEFWYGWHRQIEPLVTAGFRVVVPDQRGYNLTRLRRPRHRRSTRSGQNLSRRP